MYRDLDDVQLGAKCRSYEEWLYQIPFDRVCKLQILSKLRSQ